MRARLGAALLIALLVLGGPVGRAGAEEPREPDFGEMDAFVETTMHDVGLPGAALAIVRGDRVVHMPGFGVADPSGRPVTPQTPFRIGSVTKSVTALAVMQLVERGAVDLDAPVRRYLPWFRLADEEAAGRITVAQLLDHTSGIPASALYGSWVDPALSLEEYGRRLATVRSDRPVGGAYEYANANYNLLGLVVEAVSGQHYADYVQEHVFAPLGMARSAATPERQRAQGLAQGHAWWFGLGPFPLREEFSPANLPSAFLSSTAEDLAHYLVAQLNGGRYKAARVLSAEGVARMHAPSPRTLSGPPGREAGYGMGWATRDVDGLPVVAHDGETFGSKSLVLMDTAHGWGVVLLLNATNQLPSQDGAYRTLNAGVLARLDGRSPPALRPSAHLAYAALDAVLLLASIGIVWALLRLPAWGRGLERRRGGPRPPWRTTLTAGRAAAELLAPPAVLLGTPALVGAPWPVVLMVSPDVGRWLLAAAPLVLLLGLAHALLLARALRRRRRAADARATTALQPTAS